MERGHKLDDLMREIGDRVVLDITPERSTDGDSPWVIVRHGRHVLALCLMPLSDHLDVDAHAYVDGEAATAGVLAMDVGRAYQLGEGEAPTTTSHRWPSAGLVALLVGEQG